MSEVVKEFPPAIAGFKRKYPWHLWTDGQIHICMQGADYDSTPHAFTHAAHNHADRHGFLVTTNVRGRFVFLQFKPRRQSRSR